MHSIIAHSPDSQPLLVAIETSGVDCGVALGRGRELLASSHFRVPHIHDAMLATMVQRMIQDLDLRWDDVNGVAVSLGPGSFTGLRIGVAFAKGLCYQGSPALLGVPTLKALAQAASNLYRPSSCTRILVAYPSQRGHLYAQLFTTSAHAITSEALYTSEQFIELLKDDVVVCTSVIVPECEHHPHRHVVPLRAEYLFEEALHRFSTHGGIDAEQCVPLYVQDFVPRIQPKKIDSPA